MKFNYRYLLLLILSAFFLFSFKLLAVSDLTVTDIQKNRARLAWTAAPSVTRYELSFGTDPEASNRKTFFTENTKFDLTGLMPNTIYHVKARAVIGGRAGKWSSITTFSTIVPLVNQIKIDSIGTNYATFSWSGRYQDLPDIYYDIAFSTDEKNTPVKVDSTNNNSFTITSLEPKTKYYVKFRLRNPLKNGPWSSSRIITTLPDLASDPPDQLKIESINTNTAIISWKKVTDALSYELSYSADGHTTTVIATSEHQIKLPLSSNKEFYFKVRGLTIGDKTGWTKTVSYLTPPSVPLNINIAAQTINETIIHWSAPAGDNSTLSYQVRWKLAGSSTDIDSTSTKETRITLETLSPNNNYFVFVRAVNKTGFSPWSTSIPFSTLPEQLTDITISNITHRSAKVRWPLVSRAINYELSYGSDLSASHHSITDLKKNTVVLNKLIPDLLYYLKIRPVLPNQVFGSWSTITSFKTIVVPAIPDSPQPIKIGNDKVNLVWQVISTATNYQVMLSMDPAVIEGKSYNFKQTTGLINQLESNQHYFLKLRAKNQGGYGSWSKILKITTAPKSSPEKVTVSDIFSENAIVNWKSHPGNADLDYILRFASGQEDWQLIPPQNVPSYNLTNLLPNTSYQVQVKCQNISGQTDWSKPVSFRTPPAAPDSAPTGLNASNITDINVLCFWHRMPKVSSYIISYGTDMDASNLGEIKTFRIRYHFRSLIPDTAYYFKIKSINQSGESPWCDTLFIRTKATPPITAPPSVAIIHVSEETISLNWEKTYSISHYEVSIGTDPEAINMGNPRVVPYPPYTVEMLEPETTYFIKVRQINKGGSGPWSRILKKTTLPE